MNVDQFLSILRTLLKTGGALAISKGIGDASGWDDFIGAVLLAAGILWSWWHHGQPAIQPSGSRFGAWVILALFCGLTVGCANVHYTTTKGSGTNAVTTTFHSATLFSTTTVKGVVVDGNGNSRSEPGLRMTGIATDPNAASITATGDALGSIIGTAAAAAAKGIAGVPPVPAK